MSLPQPKPPLPAPPALRLTVWHRLRVWLNSIFIDHAFFRVFYNLRKAVAPGIYRSAHPWPYPLRAAARAGVKTVLNFRGTEDTLGSNVLEWEACERAGLKLLHLPLRSRDAPTAEEVLGLEALFENEAKPILMHCKSGADRAGLASTVYLLMRGVPLDTALKQMEFWQHGHVRQAKTGVLDHFFETYRRHHAEHGTPFREWIERHYDRNAVNASFHASWWANQLVDKVLRRE